MGCGAASAHKQAVDVVHNVLPVCGGSGVGLGASSTGVGLSLKRGRNRPDRTRILVRSTANQQVWREPSCPTMEK